METVTLNGITYEVHDTPPEGFTPCRTAASPSGRHTLYSNGVPRYLFDGPGGRGRINPAHRWALVKKHPSGFWLWSENKGWTAYEAFKEKHRKKEVQDMTVFERRALNQLAREKFKEKIVAEITCDMMVCMMERWDPRTYTYEIKTMIDDIYQKIIQKFGTQLSFF